MKKWYKVYLANNDVMLVYRTWKERWLSNSKYPKFRRDDNNRLVTFPSEARWALMWEQIPEDEVPAVREEIRRMLEEIRRMKEKMEEAKGGNGDD